MDVFDVSVRDIINEHSENKENEDDFKELHGIKIKDLTKKKVKPRKKLDMIKLLSDNGLPALPKVFEDFKFRGKGHEEEDFEVMMRKYEMWAAQLIDNLSFKDCIDKIEQLGHKRDIQNKLILYREQGIFYHGSNEIVDESLEYPKESFADDDFNAMDMIDIEGEYNTQSTSERISDISLQTPDELSARIESNRLRALEDLALKERKKRFDDFNEMAMDEDMYTEITPNISTDSQRIETQIQTSQSMNTPEEIAARIEMNRQKALEKLTQKRKMKGISTYHQSIETQSQIHPSIDTPDEMAARIAKNRLKALEKLTQKMKGRKSFLELAMSQTDDSTGSVLY